MKAIVLTTINIPKNVPEFIKKAGTKDWTAIVVGDLKTPHEEVEKICRENRSVYLSPEKQMTLGFKYAGAIGWNCYERKNLGYLFALREGAEMIYNTDDDNFPTVDNWDSYIKLGKQRLETVSSESGWWNCCTLGDANVTPRGYPTWLINEDPHYTYKVKEVDIAVQAGMWLGDPDIDAMTRMTIRPNVTKYEDKDVALDKGTMCPYNTQNTFIPRAMMPANMVWGGVRTEFDRYNDIFAGYAGQTIAQHYGKTVKFGRPFLHQDRNPHDLVRDLRNEIGGMECQKPLFNILRSMDFRSTRIAENLREIIYRATAEIPQLPATLRAQVDCWCADMEKIGL